MLAQIPTDYGPYTVLVSAVALVLAGVVVVLRWRDADVKKITSDMKVEFKEDSARRETQFNDQIAALNQRVLKMEAEIEHVKDGSITATIAAVEIRATSQEPRTVELAECIVEALKFIKPSVAVHPA